MEQRSAPSNLDEAQRIMQDSRKLKQILTSPEVRTMMQLLGKQNGDALKAAAMRAKNGDPDALKQMMDQLSQTGEGAAVLEKLGRDLAQP